jgi:hypothetical protein
MGVKGRVELDRAAEEPFCQAPFAVIVNQIDEPLLRPEKKD